MFIFCLSTSLFFVLIYMQSGVKPFKTLQEKKSWFAAPTPCCNFWRTHFTLFSLCICNYKLYVCMYFLYYYRIFQLISQSNWPLRHIADIHICQADIIWFLWNNIIPRTAEIWCKAWWWYFEVFSLLILLKLQRSGTLLKRQKLKTI